MVSQLIGFRLKTFAADRIAKLHLSRNQRGLHHNLLVDLPLNMALPVLVLQAAYALAREVAGVHQIRREQALRGLNHQRWSSLVCNLLNAQLPKQYDVLDEYPRHFRKGVTYL